MESQIEVVHKLNSNYKFEVDISDRTLPKRLTQNKLNGLMQVLDGEKERKK